MSTIWVDALGSQVRHLGRAYQTRVIEAGDGEPLLLLHGIGGHAEAYARNVVRLGARFRAMAIDLLWHGLSSKPPYVDGEDIPAYAAQVLDLLDAEGIEAAHIEGESLGGWVGLWLALHHRDRVRRLVLNTTAGIRWHQEGTPGHDPAGRAALAQRSLAAINEPSLETTRRRLEWLMASPDRVTDELVALRFRMYSDPAIQASLRPVFENAFAGTGAPRKLIDESELAGVSVPTLVLWTDHNPGAGPAVGRRIAAAIPGAQFHCLTDAAHWPQWEQPAAHDQVVTEFLLGGDVNQPAEPDAAEGPALVARS
jgi:pimeloyl-ACP methyl ester carboxylesterase